MDELARALVPLSVTAGIVGAYGAVLLGFLLAHWRDGDDDGPAGSSPGASAADYASGAVTGLDAGSGSTCGSGHATGC